MQRVIPLESRHEAERLFGTQQRHLRRVRDAFNVRVVAREGFLRIEGDESDVGLATQALQRMQDKARSGEALAEDDVADAISQAARSGDEEFGRRAIEVMGGRVVAPKTPGQKRYVEAIKRNDLVFCIGPAGTGKTYLAVAMAVSALKQEIVQRIVLARPAVEAGERLGFLPGDIAAKINPYLRPLYDALGEMMDRRQTRKYVESDLIEIVPLAYMRGRTLNDAFIILDEAQNCTVTQMKTFLTRMGQRSRIVVTGDVTQIDLAEGEMSGLVHAQGILTPMPNIDFVYLGQEDIVRHRLVQDIVDAYAATDAGRHPRPPAAHEPDSGESE